MGGVGEAVGGAVGEAVGCALGAINGAGGDGVLCGEGEGDWTEGAPAQDARTAASAAERMTRWQGTPGDGAPADKRLCGRDIVDLVTPELRARFRPDMAAAATAASNAAVVTRRRLLLVPSLCSHLVVTPDPVTLSTPPTRIKP